VRLIAPQDFERSHGQFRGQPRWCLNKGATTGIAGCCARAAIGHAAAAPPSVAKNFRRPMWLAMCPSDWGSFMQ